MQNLKDYITESILSSVGAGKTAIIKKIVADKDFSTKNIASLEKSVSVWKPKDKEELYVIINAYIKSAGRKCSLNWIDVSNIKDFSYLFSNKEFEGDISKWNTSNVTDMSYMFKNSKFNSDISKWDVSNVEYMNSMFERSNFNGDISNQNIENVKEKRYIFIGSKIQEKYKPLLK